MSLCDLDRGENNINTDRVVPPSSSETGISVLFRERVERVSSLEDGLVTSFAFA